MRKIPPKKIVLSGGGIRVIAHVGALLRLEKAGMLKAVREYIGVSAGAWLCFCLSIGYSLRTLKILCSGFDFGLLRNLEPESIFNILDNYGIDDGANLRKLIESLLRQQGLAIDITFEALYKERATSPRLRIFAADICECKPFEFSLDKTPSSTIVDALMASMCIPCYFTPIVAPGTGNLLVDGGVFHNLPLAFLTEQEAEDALGLTFSDTHAFVNKIDTLPEFFLQIYACFYIPRNETVVTKHKDKIIVIPYGHYPMWDFEASQEIRSHMLQVGYEAAEKYLSEFSLEKPVRRYSVS
jgi:predicted acylesterase/phospholipase RssA